MGGKALYNVHRNFELLLMIDQQVWSYRAMEILPAAILLLVAQFAAAGVLRRAYVCVCILYVGVADLASPAQAGLYQVDFNCGFVPR